MVVHVAGREGESLQRIPLVEDQMEFEAKEPAHGMLAPLREACKNSMTGDALVVTDRQGRRVDEVEAGVVVAIATGPINRRIAAPRRAASGLQSGQSGKLGPQIPRDMEGVVAREVPIAALRKVDQQGHDLAGGQPGNPPPPETGSELPPLCRLELLAEIIDMTEERE